MDNRKKHLARVHLAKERLDDLQEALRAPVDHARRQLEQTIKEAVTDGVPQTQIAKATGYSRKHIQNVLAGAPGRRSTDQPYLRLLSEGTFDYEGGGGMFESELPNSGNSGVGSDSSPPTSFMRADSGSEVWQGTPLPRNR